MSNVINLEKVDIGKGRQLYSSRAEQDVLGGIMLNDSVFDEISEHISENDFYFPQNGRIFKEMVALYSKGSPIDISTVSESLGKDLEAVGGLFYLGEIAKNVPHGINAVAYAKTVKEYSVRRELIKKQEECLNLAYNTDIPIKEVLDKSEAEILAVSENSRNSDSKLVCTEEGLRKTIDRIETLYESGSSITGVSTGYIDLDRLTSGLQPSDLIVVAGRTSMGKTAFALNIVERAVMKEEGAILIFSTEMPCEQIWMRLLASNGKLNVHKVRTGQLIEDDWSKLYISIRNFQGKQIVIDDSGMPTPFEIRSRARSVKRKFGKLNLIVIDYLQRLTIPGFKGNSVNEISKIASYMKGLARELDVPVILVSQLNRNVEQRTEKRPILSDLRESGAIEQEADLILFVYRDEVYHKDSKDKGTAEIIISKQRNGPKETVRLTFMDQYCKFENYSQEKQDYPF